MKNVFNKTQISKLLLVAGISPSVSGYSYLVTAIMIKLSQPEMSMCKLYDAVGQENGVSACAVERSMRFAVTRAYNLNKLTGLNEMFHAVVISCVPMLSEFIMYVVEYLDTENRI